MPRFTQIIVMASLATTALTGTAFGSAATGKDFRSPDARDAAQSTISVIDLRSPDARDAVRGPAGSDGAKTSEITDLRSPDARDTTGISTFKPAPLRRRVSSGWPRTDSSGATPESAPPQCSASSRCAAACCCW